MNDCIIIQYLVWLFDTQKSFPIWQSVPIISASTSCWAADFANFTNLRALTNGNQADDIASLCAHLNSIFYSTVIMFLWCWYSRTTFFFSQVGHAASVEVSVCYSRKYKSIYFPFQATLGSSHARLINTWIFLSFLWLGSSFHSKHFSPFCGWISGCLSS